MSSVPYCDPFLTFLTAIRLVQSSIPDGYICSVLPSSSLTLFVLSSHRPLTIIWSLLTFGPCYIQWAGSRWGFLFWKYFQLLVFSRKQGRHVTGSWTTMSAAAHPDSAQTPKIPSQNVLNLLCSRAQAALRQPLRPSNLALIVIMMPGTTA